MMPPNDDGLYHDEVGSWTKDKYRLVSLYDELFSTGMKGKWTRVYVDLYSGSGLARVRNTSRFLWGSPILALTVRDPFDKYVFCEKSEDSLRALRARVQRLAPAADVSYVQGDCNDGIEEICALIPSASTSQRVLSFCFVDPYDISTRFSTVRRVAEHYVDFLFLLALYMDANRNAAHYADPGNQKIDDFLGRADWRERWAEAQGEGKVFPRFLAEEYASQIRTLGYRPVPFHKMKQIRSDEKNLPLYHLALFSRSDLAYEYWDQVLKYGNPQRDFPF